MTATSIDAPEDIVAECREAILEIIRRWPHSYGPRGLRIAFDPAAVTRDLVREILEEAGDRGQAGEAAECLVAAALTLRFPQLALDDPGASEADQRSASPGAVRVGDTSFHVAPRPTDEVCARCRQSVDQGLRLYLLVSEDHLASARVLLAGLDCVAVESIESFVGQMLDGIALYSHPQLNATFYRLLCVYNQRVKSIGLDRSLLIEIPLELASLEWG